MTRLLVLGGGIIGVTSAIVCRLAGYDVTLMSNHILGDSDAQKLPEFASAYPAASVIPHSVNVSDLDTLLEDSTNIFKCISSAAMAGVKKQKHYELSEYGLPAPVYSSRLNNFSICNAGNAPISRLGSKHASGYSFDCYFCDMPVYSEWLLDLMRKLKIRVVKERFSKDSYIPGSYDALINCLGAGAHLVFDDITPGVFIRGILLLCKYKTQSRNPFSYNYTPSVKIHPNSDGTAGDVYFYARKNHCVIGGTRELGEQTSENKFLPHFKNSVETKIINGINVPIAIYDLNKELLEQVGVSIEYPYASLVGYRHMNKNSLTGEHEAVIRLKERLFFPPIIDCFGFGGAGVTLSWGAAIKSLKLLEQVIGSSNFSITELKENLINQSKNAFTKHEYTTEY